MKTIYKYSEEDKNVRVKAEIVENNTRKIGTTLYPLATALQTPKVNTYTKQIKVKVLGIFFYWKKIDTIKDVSATPHIKFNSNIRSAFAL